ncbi:MAG: RNA-binding S4 domain-containing protein [Bacteroidales bacterium]|nr:RNA-binding S4 domain-containing protein [Bacteroidales bacterium]
MKEFDLQNDYIELIKLLKLLRIAESGGHAKQIVEDNQVFVNGNLEKRKRAKIRSGDIVEVFDFTVKIK